MPGRIQNLMQLKTSMEIPYNSIEKLKEKFSDIYEISKLNYKGDTFYFFDSIAMFVYKLDAIIKSFPINSQLVQSIEMWIVELDQDIQKEITTGYKKLTKIQQEYRIVTRAKLREIRDSLKMELEKGNKLDTPNDTTSQTQNKWEKNNKGSSLQLSDLFESDSNYKFIMDLLVQKGYCNPTTYIWKDEKKGNKGLLVAILKQLQYLGYYKRITNKEIQDIVKTTFHLEMSVETVKKTSVDDFDVSFIPPASIRA
jgi:hypothetical protein